MKIKVIQVNIYKGKYLESLLNFLKSQAPDVITMQEVTSGIVNLNGDNSNLFEVIKRELAYDGVFYTSATILDKPDTFQGNAVFTRHTIEESDFIPLNRHSPMTLEVFNNSDFFPQFPRSVVEAKIDMNGLKIYGLSCHGAWTAPPTDTEENWRQAKLIVNHLKGLKSPFIMGADMNMPPETRVIKTVEKAAKNLVRGSKIAQTTHPTVHKIVPRGYLVDYIFTSKEIKKISIEAPEILVSDHLPLVAELELAD